MCGGRGGTTTKTKTTKLLCEWRRKIAIRDVAKRKVDIIVISISDVDLKTIAHHDHELSVNLEFLDYFFTELTSVIWRRRRTIWGQIRCYEHMYKFEGRVTYF